MRDPASDWEFEPTVQSTQMESAADEMNQSKYRRRGATRWSAVACANDGTPLVRLLGRSPVDLPYQAKTLRCELWALYWTLLHLVPLV